MNKQPLRYEIDDWSQIVQCQSNCSTYLHLTCSQIMDKTLSGTIIRVEHEKFGCLFAYMVSGSGTLLNEQVDGMYHEWDPEDVLLELEKYGFYIRFARPYNIDGPQLDNLIDVQKLGMDKIRYMFITFNGKDLFDRPTHAPGTQQIVAFDINSHPEWLANTYVCSKKEFSAALMNGTAVNLTNILNRYDWSFLQGKVLNIPDILESVETSSC